MMSLSQTTGYAIRALTYLADKGEESAFIEEIAAGADIPRAYLAKIVKKLNDAGIVNSKRGYRGGVWLAHAPQDVHLLKICEALDGEAYLSSCLLGEEFCSDARNCPTHQFWKREREKIRQELRNTSLADVVAFNKRREASRQKMS